MTCSILMTFLFVRCLVSLFIQQNRFYLLLGCLLVAIMTVSHHLLWTYWWRLSPICARNVWWHIGHGCVAAGRESSRWRRWTFLHWQFRLAWAIWSVSNCIMPLRLRQTVLYLFVNIRMPWTPVLGTISQVLVSGLHFVKSRLRQSLNLLF